MLTIIVSQGHQGAGAATRLAGVFLEHMLNRFDGVALEP